MLMRIKDADCSHAVCRHARTPISLDAPAGIVEGGGVAVHSVGEADTIDGLAWKGCSH